jgi:hypothetical protein
MHLSVQAGVSPDPWEVEKELVARLGKGRVCIRRRTHRPKEVDRLRLPPHVTNYDV